MGEINLILYVIQLLNVTASVIAIKVVLISVRICRMLGLFEQVIILAFMEALARRISRQ